jgi:hypothetical protein
MSLSVAHTSLKSSLILNRDWRYLRRKISVAGFRSNENLMVSSTVSSEKTQIENPLMEGYEKLLSVLLLCAEASPTGEIHLTTV